MKLEKALITSNQVVCIKISKQSTSKPNGTEVIRMNTRSTTKENAKNINQSLRCNDKSVSQLDGNRKFEEAPIALNQIVPTVNANHLIVAKNVSTSAIAQIEYRIGEIVWAKLGHWPAWPAKIEQIYGVSNQMVEIFWFNDYRRSKLHKANVFKFFIFFDQFSSIASSTIGLECAIKEAVILEASRRIETRY